MVFDIWCSVVLLASILLSGEALLSHVTYVYLNCVFFVCVCEYLHVYV